MKRASPAGNGTSGGTLFAGVDEHLARPVASRCRKQEGDGLITMIVAVGGWVPEQLHLPQLVQSARQQFVKPLLPVGSIGVGNGCGAPQGRFGGVSRRDFRPLAGLYGSGPRPRSELPQTVAFLRTVCQAVGSKQVT